MKTKLKLSKKLLGTWTGLLILGVLSGCSGVNPEHNLNNMHSFMLSQGKPAAYVDGYIDGCSTGRRMAGDRKYNYRRNVVRAERDSLYARGWQDGQICCRNEVLAEQEQAARAQAMGNVDQERQRRIESDSRKMDAEVQEMWEFLKK